MEVTGTIKCASNIQIDGTLNGDLVCNGNAVIGTSAQVKGNITVESVTVLGQITGNITAKDRIEMKATTRMNGDIKAKRLTVEDGVSFVGKSEVNPSGASAGKPASPEPRPAADASAETADSDTRDAKARPAGMFGKR